MQIITAVTKDHTYNVYIGCNILDRINLAICNLPSNRIVIVTEQQIAGQFLQLVQNQLLNCTVDVIVLKMGEQNKTLTAVCSILDLLVEKQHTRDSIILSLGGGVISDVAGFAASIYMRGMRLMHLPTTLLAQVDAALGGKTGCNYAGIKNIVGTFYQPDAVFIDTFFLESLPVRDYNAGIAEIIKYGIACDSEFFLWLEKNITLLRDRDPAAVLYAIERSCRNKLRIVALDEQDRGARMALNFGHTFAHAIESVTGFKRYLHGEAVALGMLLATEFAYKLKMIEYEVLLRLDKVISYLPLPKRLEFEAYTAAQLCAFMLHDKKNSAEGINLILPCALGAVRVVKVMQIERIEELFKDYVTS